MEHKRQSIPYCLGAFAAFLVFSYLAVHFISPSSENSSPPKTPITDHFKENTTSQNNMYIVTTPGVNLQSSIQQLRNESSKTPDERQKIPSEILCLAPIALLISYLLYLGDRGRRLRSAHR